MGEIRYLQIPATDIEASARFYADAFGWTIRTRSDGKIAFDDNSGHVSGSWVLDRAPAGQSGLLTYLRVDDVQTALDRIVTAGGEAAGPVTPQNTVEAIALFRDPAGNVLGIFHEGEQLTDEE
jgi:predicted enzyme related to lactoylglutathione lyase